MLGVIRVFVLPRDGQLKRAFQLRLLAAALALIETPMGFCGLSLGGSVCKFGAAREHCWMIWVCFDGEADPHH